MVLKQKVLPFDLSLKYDKLDNTIKAKNRK